MYKKTLILYIFTFLNLHADPAIDTITINQQDVQLIRDYFRRLLQQQNFIEPISHDSQPEHVLYEEVISDGYELIEQD